MTDEELKEFDKDFSKIKVIPLKSTFLDVINKTHDENIVSNWLSFIFNPDENGIGNKPIELLLNSVGCEYELENDNFKEIHREETTDNGRKRMDIVIKYSKLWIIIENKIDSFEHDKQTEKYFNYIEEKRKNERKKRIRAEYIYLRPDWNQPDDENVPAKKFNGKEGFRNLFYSELIKQLKKINTSDYKESEKFEYLKEFIKVGEKYYMGKEIKITDDIAIYIKHKKNITDIQKKYNEINNNIREKLENRLKNQFEKDNNYFVNRAGPYYQIVKNNWKNINNIHYEILYYGFPSLLGEKNAKINYDIHIEGKAVSNENIEKIIIPQMKEKYGIKPDPTRSKSIWFKLSNNDDVYNFENEEEIDKSIDKIVERMKEIDKKYTKEIDNENIL